MKLSKEKLKKIYIYVLSVVMAFFLAFYYLAGDQLKYRDSRYNIIVGDADIATTEIIDGVTVRQNFVNKVERLKSVSVQCTTFYRKNTGFVTVKLFDGEELLLSGTFNAANIDEGEYIDVYADDYIEGHNGKELSLYVTSTSPKGSGIALLTNVTSDNKVSLLVGKTFLPGSLCYMVQGQENIFTGTYYWQMAAGFVAVVAALLIYSYRRYCDGKSDYISNAINAVYKYSFLISQLVLRDFKTKYKRSILGVFWSFLNPLLTMTVQYVIFSTLFRNTIENYAVYLLTGIISFSFFSEVTNMCILSITGNAPLIKKVYIPKYIFPLSRTLSSSVNLLISLIPLIMISLITGVVLHKSIFLIVYFLVCLIVFALGVGMFLSCTVVFFTDIKFLWTVIVMMWQYATPIFYNPSIIPARFQFILDFNPMHHFIKNIRLCLIDGISPGPKSYLFCLVFAIGSLLIGSLVFKKTQDKFTLYL